VLFFLIIRRSGLINNSEGECPPDWPIFIKPPTAGTRILSLDGGGVRGIVELTILQQIERELGGGLYIQDFFDLIVGTSTGGIIALGLGACGRSVDKCISSFWSLCEKAFTKRKGIGFPGIEFFVSASNHSKFETRPLESALQNFYGEGLLFGGPQHKLESAELRRLTKVAVTMTTTSGSVVVAGNYNRHNNAEDLSYRFYRSEKPDNEMKVWEAARATSAAPRIFKPFFHSNSGQSYQDGAIYYNNPVDIAMLEQRLIWPESQDRHPDILLSIGTGYNPATEPRDSRSTSKPSTWGVLSHMRGLAKIGIDHVHNSLNSERTWKIFMERYLPYDRFKDRYIRVNLTLDNDPPKLDDVQAMGKLRDMTRSRFTKEKDQIQTIADRLIASSFYFEPLPSPNAIENSDGSFTVKGSIFCRFSQGSDQIHYLGEVFRRRSQSIFNRGSGEHQLYFVIRERRRERDAMSLLITERIMSAMTRDCHFSMGKVEVRLAEKMAEIDILLCVNGDRAQPNFYPISGFPRCLLDDYLNSTSPESTSLFHRTAANLYIQHPWAVRSSLLVSVAPERATSCSTEKLGVNHLRRRPSFKRTRSNVTRILIICIPEMKQGTVSLLSPVGFRVHRTVMPLSAVTLDILVTETIHQQWAYSTQISIARTARSHMSFQEKISRSCLS
jgi:predicted acylesterase/phospholipase RssA